MKAGLMRDLEDQVLGAILDERRRQDENYGDVNDSLKDGTGPLVQWLGGFDWMGPVGDLDAAQIEQCLREDYEKNSARNGGSGTTWMHLVREEVAEAFKESDLDRLEEEVNQIAALCVAWLVRIKARKVGAL